MALFDVQVGVLANQAMNYLVSGVAPSRLGNAHPNIVPYQVFAAADGNLVIAVGNDGQFRNLVGVLGVGDIADHPSFATNEARVANRTALIAGLSALVAKFPRADLLKRLERARVPAGPINTVAEVFADPQIIDRGMRFNLPRVGGNDVPTVRTPILMSESHLAYHRASPRLGEHTSEVLAEVGYDMTEVTGLMTTGVVGGV
jgi:crotonobetainyl-CoA:carnitine CoA-transferase CaiB-like acyl-CoA transferase